MSFKFNRNKEEKCRKKNKDNQENLLNKFKIDITSKLKATIGRMEDI